MSVMTQKPIQISVMTPAQELVRSRKPQMMSKQVLRKQTKLASKLELLKWKTHFKY